VYVANCGRVYATLSDMLMVIDGSGDSLLTPLPTLPFPVIAAVNEADGKLYLRHYIENRFSVADCGRGRVVAEYPLAEPHGATWNAGETVRFSRVWTGR